jgi:glycosyltransferase involved in cell wall biosynthesis
VLTISEFSRREIVERLGLPSARVRVIYPGVRLPAHAVSVGPREPLVLYVGSLFQRRHVDVLIDAFARVQAHVPDARLELVGENRTRPFVDFGQRVRRLGIGDTVGIRSYVDEATLAELYARAAVFVFLSEYEGFGLTPLEALAAGVPPIVLDTAVVREVLAPAARFVPGLGEAERVVAQLVVELLTNEAARRDVLAAGPDVLARYQWPHAASQTLRVLEEAAGA